MKEYVKNLVQRIHLLLHSSSSVSILVTLFWIPGHINLPDHDAVDHAAKQSLLSPSITDPSLIPAYDLKSYYHSLISNSWHKYWHSLSSNKLRRIEKKLQSPRLLPTELFAMKKSSLPVFALATSISPTLSSISAFNFSPPTPTWCRN